MIDQTFGSDICGVITKYLEEPDDAWWEQYWIEKELMQEYQESRS